MATRTSGPASARWPSPSRAAGSGCVAPHRSWIWRSRRRRRDAGRADSERIVAYVNMARTAIERVCLDIIELVERSIGVRGMLRRTRSSGWSVI